MGKNQSKEDTTVVGKIGKVLISKFRLILQKAKAIRTLR